MFKHPSVFHWKRILPGENWDCKLVEPVLINYALFVSILTVNMKEDWKLIFNLIIFRLGKWMREDFCWRVDPYYLSYTIDDISSKQPQPTFFQLASVSAEILFFNWETEQYKNPEKMVIVL